MSETLLQLAPELGDKATRRIQEHAARPRPFQPVSFDSEIRTAERFLGWHDIRWIRPSGIHLLRSSKPARSLS
jgi:hypothetical protein